MIVKLLKSYWFELAIGLVFGAMYISIAILSGKLERAREELTAVRAENQLKDSMIDQQNAAVESLVVQREEDRNAYLAGIAAANKRAIKIEVDAQRILSIPTPATREEQCSAAETLLRKELTQ